MASTCGEGNPMIENKGVLFDCIENICRGQMAEAFAHLYELIEVNDHAKG
jgi:protein-tyrosine-phosphatase